MFKTLHSMYENASLMPGYIQYVKVVWNSSSSLPSTKFFLDVFFPSYRTSLSSRGDAARRRNLPDSRDGWMSSSSPSSSNDPSTTLAPVSTRIKMKYIFPFGMLGTVHKTAFWVDLPPYFCDKWLQLPIQWRWCHEWARLPHFHSRCIHVSVNHTVDNFQVFKVAFFF